MLFVEYLGIVLILPNFFSCPRRPLISCKMAASVNLMMPKCPQECVNNINFGNFGYNLKHFNNWSHSYLTFLQLFYDTWSFSCIPGCKLLWHTSSKCCNTIKTSFHPKCPQFLLKMSPSIACTLAGFWASGAQIVKTVESKLVFLMTSGMTFSDLCLCYYCGWCWKIW